MTWLYLMARSNRIGNNVISQCLDNRIGCWVVIRAMQKLEHHNCEIHAVWTVQEEVGVRGAGPAAFAVAPDIAICCDVPGVPTEERVTALGRGVCLEVMDSSTIADIGLVRDIEKVASLKKIPCRAGCCRRGARMEDRMEEWSSAAGLEYARRCWPARSRISTR